MALKKDITLDNGIVLNYHRIHEIENIVNKNTILRIYSYLNENERGKEKQDEKNSMTYKVESIEIIGYNDKLSIEDAYNYLKTTEKYKNAEDI